MGPFDVDDLFAASIDGWSTEGERDCVLLHKEVSNKTALKIQKVLDTALRLSGGDESAAVKMFGSITPDGWLPSLGVKAYVEQGIVEMAIVGAPQMRLVITARNWSIGPGASRIPIAAPARRIDLIIRRSMPSESEILGKLRAVIGAFYAFTAHEAANKETTETRCLRTITKACCREPILKITKAKGVGAPWIVKLINSDHTLHPMVAAPAEPLSIIEVSIRAFCLFVTERCHVRHATIVQNNASFVVYIFR